MNQTCQVELFSTRKPQITPFKQRVVPEGEGEGRDFSALVRRFLAKGGERDEKKQGLHCPQESNLYETAVLALLLPNISQAENGVKTDSVERGEEIVDWESVGLNGRPVEQNLSAEDLAGARRVAEEKVERPTFDSSLASDPIEREELVPLSAGQERTIPGQSLLNSEPPIKAGEGAEGLDSMEGREVTATEVSGQTTESPLPVGLKGEKKEGQETAGFSRPNLHSQLAIGSKPPEKKDATMDKSQENAEKLLITKDDQDSRVSIVADGTEGKTRKERDLVENKQKILVHGKLSSKREGESFKGETFLGKTLTGEKTGHAQNTKVEVINRKDSEPVKGSTVTERQDYLEAASGLKQEAVTANPLESKENPAVDFNLPTVSADRTQVQGEKGQTTDAAGKREGVELQDKVVKQILNGARFLVKNGVARVEMSLEPRELGKLELSMVIERDVVTASFVAESKTVQAIIESNLNDLRSSLQETGFKADSLQVSVQADSFGRREETASQSQFAQGPKFAGRDYSPEETEEIHVPPAWTWGRVDFRA